ncbi:MAG: hypothetical protein OCC49_17900, partial [Fibrobacterales bacterium]
MNTARSKDKNEMGFSIILVLSIIILATVATTTISQYLSNENKTSGSRVAAQSSEVLFNNALSAVESWLVHSTERVAATINYLEDIQKQGTEIVFNATSEIVPSTMNAKVHIVGFKRVNDNTYQFVFNVDALGTGNSRVVKNVAYNVAGFYKEAPNSCPKGDVNYGMFIATPINCTDAVFDIYGDVFHNGSSCINGRMRVFGYNDMQGNFISTGNAKSASNYHGTISTQGKLLLTNQGPT